MIRPYDEIMQAIKRLSVENQVYVIYSGLSHDLDIHFKNMANVKLFAENGFLFKLDSKWKQLFTFDSSCFRLVKKIMEQYQSKTEGTKILIKQSSITWIVNSNWEEMGQKLAADLVANLKLVLERFSELEVVQNKNYVEVRPINLNKGLLLDMILEKEVSQQGKFDLLLAFGRGSYDEDLFAQLRMLRSYPSKYFNENGQIYSISVGLVPSYAGYFIKSQNELIQLLKLIS